MAEDFTDGSGAGSVTVNYLGTVSITKFGLQAGTDRTVFVTWKWNGLYTKEYRVIWYYYTGNGVAFVGNDSTTTSKQSSYSAPSNATSVSVKIKPISQTRKVNGHDILWWTATWSTMKNYSFASNPPSKPSAPTVTVEKQKLTAKLDNLDVNGTQIEFYVVKNNLKKYKSGKATIHTNSASWSCTLATGAEYKVRCRSWRGRLHSEWSDYSSNVSSTPAAPKSIKTLKALSTTGVYLEWTKVTGCTKYEVQYVTNRSYFGSNPDQVHTRTVENVTHTEITGIETGYQYFFRVRAYNSDDQASNWTPVKSLKLGQNPGAPTTWSSTTTAMVGESVRLYWVHNSEDNSSQTSAQLETIIDGKKTTETIKNTKTGIHIDDTSYKSLSTKAYYEGTKILWRVRTAGITGKYGDWSVQRTIDVYSIPTLQLNITDSTDSELTTLESFPFYIKAEASPNTQTVLSYHVSITSMQTYSTSDRTGTDTLISRGQEVYSKFFDMSNDLFTDGLKNLIIELNAGNIDLENNVVYKISCIASMDSGLTASAETEFEVGWSEQTYGINAEIGYDPDTYSCSIQAFCTDEQNKLIPGITLAIYRRDYTGELIEIAGGLENGSYTYVTDPHPALDYGRYRIVATENATGAVSYYDIPPYPIKETSIIIQWDETWENLITDGLDETEIVMEPLWSGSLVKLPYNVDVSDKNGVDVSLVEYIGRKRPVSYYGTQLGETSSWRVEIPRDDADTLYALRRLAIYTGDVYVREPSGTGYWANVAVSISQTHCEVKIPVSFDITRVEGGI